MYLKGRRLSGKAFRGAFNMTHGATLGGAAAQAAVEVVDARFHLTFSHPDAVREGSAYSLFVTVVNLSQATQNLISVEIREEHITGAQKEDPTDDFIAGRRLIPGRWSPPVSWTGSAVAASWGWRSARCSPPR